MKYTDSFDSDVNKGLVIIAIQESLMRISRNDYEIVLNLLKTKYNCYITDCYLHPEYLRDILKVRYGVTSAQVINQIEEKLEEFSNQLPINEFLKKLSGRESSPLQDQKKN
ncbi:MAG: hypothetical protein ACE5EJ_04460 [Nitrosopumilaceae archaeon]